MPLIKDGSKNGGGKLVYIKDATISKRLGTLQGKYSKKNCLEITTFKYILLIIYIYIYIYIYYMHIIYISYIYIIYIYYIYIFIYIYIVCISWK